MIAATRGSAGTSGCFRRLGLLSLGFLVLSQVTLHASDKDVADVISNNGLFISVPNPIDTKVMKRVKATTERFLLQRPDQPNLKIVFDFNPNGGVTDASDYGPCRDLAQYLLSEQLRGLTTIAFVHNEVTGHMVLPVLACKEIVMSADAKLGNKGDSPLLNQPLEEDELKFYRRVAERQGRSTALVLKMVDKNMEVLQGTRRGGVSYIDKAQRVQEEQQGFVVTPGDPVLPAGGPALYDAGQARKYGLCALVTDTGKAQEVIEKYHLPPSSLRGDPLQGRDPIAWLIEVKGSVDQALQETIERRIRRAIAQKANLIILQLECGDGDTEVARSLADFLRHLKDDNHKEPIMTVAYVTKQARNTAAFLAMGCSEIVMDKEAKLGDFERYIQERPEFRNAIARSLEELARDQGYYPLLAHAMLNPEDGIHRVRSQKGPEMRGLIKEEDLQKDKDTDKKWVDEGLIKPAGQWFSLDADRAKELLVARHVFEGSPRDVLPKLYNEYGLEGDRVHVAGLDWLDGLALFLCQPLVSVFLVMLGIAGLILELKMPGVGFPGVVAALCFVLYFWAHSQLAGHLTMLAVLLFVLGLILIGLEVFVFPGFGVTGISGIVLMMVSLTLATLVKKPETSQEWMDFATTLTTLGVGLLLAVGGALTLACYLPSIPYANRLVLAPPSEREDALEGDSTALPQAPPALLGAIGVAATNLRPAGKARIGDDFVDVVAEGSYVLAGTRVQVIEIEGNRIVVKEI